MDITSQGREAAELLDRVASEFDVVMLLSTARRRAQGVTRLPDRIDRGRRIAALQVETDDQARDVLRRLDRPGLLFVVDVERKQEVDLLRVARAEVVRGRYTTVKANDVTVDALDAVISHHLGTDLVDVVVALVGTGNLGFKSALRLAERGAQVSLVGRDAAKAELLCRALNAILPRFNHHFVEPGVPDVVRVLIVAATARHVVDEGWLDRLADRALCIDVGIDNFAPGFVASANERGHTCLRLDVRAAGSALHIDPNPFFTDVAGRSVIAGHDVVAGGYLGRRGEIVLDQIKEPRQVVGLANGTGGLLDPAQWREEQTLAVAAVKATIDRRPPQ
jgi:hypothetical protein